MRVPDKEIGKRLLSTKFPNDLTTTLGDNLRLTIRFGVTETQHGWSTVCFSCLIFSWR